MENEKTEGIKKETTCLFYNLEIKEDKTPLSRKITDKKRKIAEINIKIDSYLKNNSTENNSPERDSYGYYKHILSKYMTSHINNRKNKTNGKKINNSKLNTKIYFGSFLMEVMNLMDMKIFVNSIILKQLYQNQKIFHL